MAQSDDARQTRRRLDHRHAGRAHADASGRAASPNKLMQAATALAIVARHGHEATLAHYLRLAPYGLERPWRRPRGALLFRQAGRRSLLGAGGAARRHSAIAGADEHHARERPAARGGARALRHRAARRGRRARRRAGGAGARANSITCARSTPSAVPKRCIWRCATKRSRARACARPRRDGDPAHPCDDRSWRSNGTSLHLARRYLSNFRGAGARQVAVMVVERGTERRHRRRRLRRLRRPAAPAPSISPACGVRRARR